MATTIIPRTNNMTGFSLLELLFVMAIISLISALAYPAYQTYLQQTRRTTAQAELLHLANVMERHYLEHFSYDLSAQNTTLPFTRSPRQGKPVYYHFTVDYGERFYLLSATPMGAQTADRCGIMTLNHAGQRQAERLDCW